MIQFLEPQKKSKHAKETDFQGYKWENFEVISWGRVGGRNWRKMFIKSDPKDKIHGDAAERSGIFTQPWKPSKINHEHVGKFIPDTVRPHGIRWMGSWNKKKIKKTSQSRISDHLFLVVSPKLQHQGGFLCTPKRTPPVGSMFFFNKKTPHKSQSHNT